MIYVENIRNNFFINFCLHLGTSDFFFFFFGFLTGEPRDIFPLVPLQLGVSDYMRYVCDRPIFEKRTQADDQ